MAAGFQAFLTSILGRGELHVWRVYLQHYCKPFFVVFNETDQQKSLWKYQITIFPTKKDYPSRNLYFVLPDRGYCQLLNYILCALVWKMSIIAEPNHGDFLLAKVRWGIRIAKHRIHWWKTVSHRHGQKLLATLGCGSVHFLWNQYTSFYTALRTSLHTIYSTVKIHSTFCILNSNFNFLFALNDFENPA